MKPTKPLAKRRRNGPTWAEAATLALQQSSTKVLGIRTILQTIYDNKLKEISLDKAAENVLTTMLNHHAQLPNCPFFRVKGRYGLYALKESWLKRNSGTTAGNNCALNGLENENDSLGKSKLTSAKPRPHEDNKLDGDFVGRSNHEFSIQGRALPPEPTRRHQKVALSEQENIERASYPSPSHTTGENRPPQSETEKLRCSRSNSHHHSSLQHCAPVARINSWPARRSSNDVDDHQFTSNLDLETPSSILVNANIKTLVNKETFAMLPPSYRYKLTQLLPSCDRKVESAKENDQKIFVPSATALNNEFFSQAVQEWKDRLSEGEFTRETQSRIAQEIAKERSKIDPWKEKFFEEFYGQKQVTNKRLRRGTETNHIVQDFSIDAQLAKFTDLRKELQESFQPAPSAVNEGSRYLTTRNKNHIIHNQRRTFGSLSSKKPYNNYAKRVAMSKVASSKLTKLKSGLAGAKSPLPQVPRVPPVPSSIVMKPSGSFKTLVASQAKQLENLASKIGNVSDSNTETISNQQVVRKEVASTPAAIFDHAYTSAPWQQSLKMEKESVDPYQGNPTSQAKSSTLVLYPQGNLVNSTIAIMQSGGQVPKLNPTVSNPIPTPTSNFLLSKKEVAFKIISTLPPVRSASGTCDTERVLSLCARPLTPESFVTGTSKPSNAFITTIKQVPSPLSIDATASLSCSTSVSSVSKIAISTTSTFQKQATISAKCDVTNTVVSQQSSMVQASLLPLQTLKIAAMPRTSAVQAPFTCHSVVAPTLTPGPLLSILHAEKTQGQAGSPRVSPNSHLQSLNSPLAPGRLTIAGNKRSQSMSQITPSPPSAKWGSTSSPSPPMKKTRTLAEIKAQMKARKAAAAAASGTVTATRPASGMQQSGVVAANTHSHMFCATTFPVYFPLVTSSPSSMVMPTSISPQLQPASYIRLPTTGNLPLERLHWVNQPENTLKTPESSASTQTLLTTNALPPSTLCQQIIKPRTSGNTQNQPNEKPRRGKITLKIKTGGSAISLKVDADVIKKELKRTASSTTSEEDILHPSEDDSSSNESESEDSDDDEDADRSRSSPVKQSSDSETDTTRLQATRWPSQQKETTNLTVTTSSLLVKHQQSTAVFGVPPYNISIKTTSCGSADTSFVNSSLFKSKTSSLSFRNMPISSSWSNSTSVNSEAKISSSPSTTSLVTTSALPSSAAKPPSKFKSTSKGKNMQDLAKSSMPHSDDSADNDADSSDDEHARISTTTASENDKCTESDDSSQSWKPGQPDSPESSLSDDATKRPTHFPLRKAVKSREGKTSSHKVLSLATSK